MSIEERALHELRTGLEEVLGPERAATLMSRLSPVSWPDVVTKTYLDERLSQLDERLNAKFDAVDTKFDAVDAKFVALDERLTLTIKAEVATHHAALSDQMTSQTRTMIFALLSTLLMVTALLLAIR